MKRPIGCATVQTTMLKAVVLVSLLVLTTGASCEQKLPIIEPSLENPYKDYPYHYKGQVHAHSSRSSDVEEVYANKPNGILRAYRSKGYDFIALTDHDQPCSVIFEDPNDIQDEFIIYIPSEEDCDWEDKGHLLAIGLTQQQDPCGPVCGWGDQERIDHVVDQGAIAVLAHPYATKDCTLLDCPFKNDHTWGVDNDVDRVEENVLGRLSRFHGLVVKRPEEVLLWDKLLSLGRDRRAWGFTEDDSHGVEDNYRSFNRAWIVVNSSKGPPSEWLQGPRWYNDRDELREHLLENIEYGNFYVVVRSPGISGDTPSDGPADIGPELEIKVLGGVVQVTSDQKCEEIRFIGGPDRVLHRERNRTSAHYTVDDSEQYVRVEIDQNRPDGEFYTAYSQPLYVVKQGLEGGAFDAETGTGIPYVKITLVSEDGRTTVYQKTDDHGGYRVRLPKGRYVATATHPDYEDYSSAPGFWVVGDGFGTANIEMPKK